MGYQITWDVKELPEDVHSKYKSFYSNESLLQDSIYTTKHELLVYCYNISKESLIDVKTLKLKIDFYKKLLEEAWKINLTSRLTEDKLWFCGWEYAKDKEDCDYTGIIYDSLYTYCFCTKAADPIDGSEYFFEKAEKIASEINSLEEAVDNYMTHRFVDTYREYQIKYDDDV